jgi:hypothetical protein
LILGKTAAMRNNIRVYFHESSIHGFPYIVNRNLHIVEKMMWIIALLISFVCCGLLIFEIGVKYQEDAMVTYTSDTAIAVTEVSVKPSTKVVFFYCRFFHSRRFHFLL